MNKTDQMNSSFKDGTAKSRPKLKSRIVFHEKIKIMNLSMSDNYEEIPKSDELGWFYPNWGLARLALNC